jgi:glyoxalase family protein
MADQPNIQGHHHVTLCVGGAQEDYDFHTKVLSLKNVKKTALYDGVYPIRHFYYGNDMGEASNLVTCFPMRQSKRKGRQGNDQIATLALSIPDSSYDYWKKRLSDMGFDPKEGARFGEKILSFSHPCGIAYELATVPQDRRKAFGGGDVPAELAIHGTHGITVRTREIEVSDEFMDQGWNLKRVATEGDYSRWAFNGNAESGRFVDVKHEANMPNGTWTFGEGTIHHCAFEVADLDVQANVKMNLEGLGFTDTSDVKDRGYFWSIYVRTPSGALFEATVSKPEGMMIDESYEELGSTLQVPPVFQDQKDEIINFLDQEPLMY